MVQEVCTERGTAASIWTGRLLSATPSPSDDGRGILRVLSRGFGGVDSLRARHFSWKNEDFENRGQFGSPSALAFFGLDGGIPLAIPRPAINAKLHR
jgi:hypothetical protein